MASQLFVFIGGIVFGAVAAWLAFRNTLRASIETAKAQVGVEAAAIKATLEVKELQLQDLTARLNTKDAEAQRLSSELKTEAAARAGLEEKSARIPQLEADLSHKVCEIAALQSQLSDLKSDGARLETAMQKEKKSADEKLAILNEAQQKLGDAFKALSSDALKSNNQSFLDLAKSTLEKFQQSAVTDLSARQKAIDDVVKPLKESLDKVDGKIAAIEKDRLSAYSTLTEQVKSLGTTQLQLHAETANLVKALRAPQVRGRWGEIQLKRVVEMAGMLDHCDFYQQESVTTEDGRLRPDLIVRLPGNKNVVVDAKCALQAYLDSLSATDEAARAILLKQHARQIGTHINKLAAKGYWDQFTPAPEFVVLFLPGETFFSAALEQDPRLIEAGVEQRVILATPTTLISLLRAVSYGWRQEQVAKNAQAISDLGRELYDRMRILAEHFTDVGGKLDGAVNAYNRAAAALESRVLVSARRLKELGTGNNTDIEPAPVIDRASRQLQAPELAPVRVATQQQIDI
jgi:DNA recombination protein RmuC